MSNGQVFTQSPRWIYGKTEGREREGKGKKKWERGKGEGRVEM